MLRKIIDAKVHISWQIATLSGGILVGAATATQLTAWWQFDIHLWLAAATSLAIIGFLKKSLVFMPLLLLAGSIIGVLIGTNQQQKLATYQQFYSSSVVIQARVADDTTYGPRGDLRLRLDKVTIESKDLPGDIWVSTATSANIKRGDIIKLSGYLNEGFGNLSASIYRANLLDVYRPEPGDIARRTRDMLANHIRSAISEPESLLGVSFLFGQKLILPSDLLDRLRLLGLAHVVVASGFHLTIVVKYIRRSLAKLSKYLATLVSFLAVAGFLLVTGFSTSMTRAALVTGFSLIAAYYGRNFHPVILLLVVAATTILIDPAAISGDVGWFLSFAAFAGVIILSPLLNSYFWGESKPGMWRYIILATTSAQITTFPIIAHFFGQYSPLALVSNLAILPLVPLAMLLSLVAGLVNIVAPAISTVTGWPAYVILRYMNEITEKLANLKIASNEIEFSILAVIVSYIFILLLILYLKKVTGYNLRTENPVE
ncbi:MAG: ComEC/Rec2 family competence protein [Candidatus Saccharimonadales bacterium]